MTASRAAVARGTAALAIPRRRVLRRRALLLGAPALLAASRAPASDARSDSEAFRDRYVLVNLETGAEAAYPASSGMLAVARIAATVNTSPQTPIAFPSVAEAPDYYSAAQTLLARVAWQERQPA